jgi:hypothetical protein
MLSTRLALTTISVIVGERGIVVINPLYAHLDGLYSLTQSWVLCRTMLSTRLALTTISVKVGEPGIVVMNPLVCTLGRLANLTKQEECYLSSPTLVMLNSNVKLWKL